MLRLATTLTLLGLLLAGQPALSAPPAEAKPLSEIAKMLEDSGNVAYIAEIEWDDRGYWDVDYVRGDGGKVEVKLNPVSGQPKR